VYDIKYQCNGEMKKNSVQHFVTAAYISLNLSKDCGALFAQLVKS